MAVEALDLPAEPRRKALADALDVLQDEAATVIEEALAPVLARTAGRIGEGAAIVALTASVVDDLTPILTEWGVAVDARVLPYFERLYRAGGLAALSQYAEVSTGGPVDPMDVEAFERTLDEAGLLDAVRASDLTEGAARHVAMSRNRFVEIGDQAWDEARTALLRGIEQGQSAPRIARELRAVVDVTMTQARMIARTEVISATNAGALAQARQLGEEAPTYKQWIATLDDRTRESHWEADTQIVPMADLFEVGATVLEFPGDPSGPWEEIANCRCSLLFTDDPAGEMQGVVGRGQGGVLAETPPAEGLVAAMGSTNDSLLDAANPYHEPGTGRFDFSPGGTAPLRGAEAEAYLDGKHSDEWANLHLKEEYRGAVDAWNDKYSFVEIQGHLRGNRWLVNDKKRGTAEALAELARTEKLDRPVVAYQGLDLDSFEGFQGGGLSDVEGVRLTDPGLTTATLDRGWAANFTRGSTNGVVVEMEVPAGTGGVWLDNFASSQGKVVSTESGTEKELLLEPGLTVEITGRSNRMAYDKVSGIEVPMVTGRVVRP